MSKKHSKVSHVCETALKEIAEAAMELCECEDLESRRVFGTMVLTNTVDDFDEVNGAILVRYVPDEEVGVRLFFVRFDEDGQILVCASGDKVSNRVIMHYNEEKHLCFGNIKCFEGKLYSLSCVMSMLIKARNRINEIAC